MLEASNFVSAVENRQGLMVLSPDEISWAGLALTIEKI